MMLMVNLLHSSSTQMIGKKMKALNFFDILKENGLIDLGLAFGQIKKTEI